MAALPLSAGSHEIEFRYYNKDLTIGIIISLISLLVFALLIIIDWRRKMKREEGKGKTSLVQEQILAS